MSYGGYLVLYYGVQAGHILWVSSGHVICWSFNLVLQGHLVIFYGGHLVMSYGGHLVKSYGGHMVMSYGVICSCPMEVICSCPTGLSCHFLWVSSGHVHCPMGVIWSYQMGILSNRALFPLGLTLQFTICIGGGMQWFDAKVVVVDVVLI